MKILKLAFASAAVVAIYAGRAADTYTIRLDPKVGDTFNYKVSMSGAQEMTLETSIKTVKNDASQVVMEYRAGSMTFMGAPAPQQVEDMMKNVVVTVTEDHSGHLLNTAVTGAPPEIEDQLKKQGAGASASYPDHAVAVGDTWTGDMVIGGTKTKPHFKLARIDSIQGKQAAVIEVTLDPGSSIKSNGPMTMSVELANGMPLQYKVSLDVQGQTETMEMNRT